MRDKPSQPATPGNARTAIMDAALYGVGVLDGRQGRRIPPAEFFAPPGKTAARRDPPPDLCYTPVGSIAPLDTLDIKAEVSRRFWERVFTACESQFWNAAAGRPWSSVAYETSAGHTVVLTPPDPAQMMAIFDDGHQRTTFDFTVMED